MLFSPETATLGPVNAVQDNLSGPLSRMAMFFLGDVCLPPVASVRDVFDYGSQLNSRGIKILPSEERFLRQVTWCMLQIQGEQEEGELQQALSRIAALTLAVIEDPDLSIPEGYAIGSRENLEDFAFRFQREWEQQDLSLGAAVGLHQLSFASAGDVSALARRLPAERDDSLARALRQGEIYLRQGEEIFARHTDPARQGAHRLRLDAAAKRLELLLARLLAVPAAQDRALVRAQLVRRELKHVEIDALGAKRVSEAEQVSETRRLLRWTEADLGQELTDSNKAALAAQLRELAEASEDSEDSGEDWLFSMS